MSVETKIEIEGSDANPDSWNRGSATVSLARDKQEIKITSSESQYSVWVTLTDLDKAIKLLKVMEE